MSSYSDTPRCEKCQKVPYNTWLEGRNNAYWMECYDCGYWENYTDNIYDPETDTYQEVEWAVRSGYNPTHTCSNCNRGMRVADVWEGGKSQDEPPSYTEYSCAMCRFSFAQNTESGLITIKQKPIGKTAR